MAWSLTTKEKRASGAFIAIHHSAVIMKRSLSKMPNIDRILAKLPISYFNSVLYSFVGKFIEESKRTERRVKPDT